MNLYGMQQKPRQVGNPAYGMPALGTGLPSGFGAGDTGGGGTIDQPATPGAPAAGTVLGGSTPATIGGNGLVDFNGLNGGKSSLKNIRKYLARLQASNAAAAQGPLWQSIGDLQRQAQTDEFSPEKRDAYLAPRLSALTQGADMAKGQLAQEMNSRFGQGDSSEEAQRWSGIRTQTNAARSGLINNLFNMEDQQKQAAGGDLRSLLAALQSGGTSSAAGIIGNIQQEQLQRDQMNQQNDPFQSILGGLFGLGAAYVGMPRLPKTQQTYQAGTSDANRLYG